MGSPRYFLRAAIRGAADACTAPVPAEGPGRLSTIGALDASWRLLKYSRRGHFEHLHARGLREGAGRQPSEKRAVGAARRRPRAAWRRSRGVP